MRTKVQCVDHNGGWKIEECSNSASSAYPLHKITPVVKLRELKKFYGISVK